MILQKGFMMFSAEENKILNEIFFQEILSICNLDFEELVIVKMIFDGYQNKFIQKKLETGERNFFKKLKKIKDKIICKSQ